MKQAKPISDPDITVKGQRCISSFSSHDISAIQGPSTTAMSKQMEAMVADYATSTSLRLSDSAPNLNMQAWKTKATPPASGLGTSTFVGPESQRGFLSSMPNKSNPPPIGSSRLPNATIPRLTGNGGNGKEDSPTLNHAVDQITTGIQQLIQGGSPGLANMYLEKGHQSHGTLPLRDSQLSHTGTPERDNLDLSEHRRVKTYTGVSPLIQEMSPEEIASLSASDNNWMNRDISADRRK